MPVIQNTMCDFPSENCRASAERSVWPFLLPCTSMWRLARFTRYSSYGEAQTKGRGRMVEAFLMTQYKLYRCVSQPSLTLHANEITFLKTKNKKQRGGATKTVAAVENFDDAFKYLIAYWRTIDYIGHTYAFEN